MRKRGASFHGKHRRDHGAGYVALARAVEIHEAQLAAITRDSARAAMLEVRRRVDRGEVPNTSPA